MTINHILTHEERQRGGWTRARQKAGERRAHPTDAERDVRDACDRLGITHLDEYEIYNPFGPYPQWIDIYLPDYQIAIEVDGSDGWHDRRYPSSRMYDYDEAKRKYCECNGIRLVVIRETFYESGELDELLQSIIMELQPEHP